MNLCLLIAGGLSTLAVIMHLGCIYFGAPWYRFLGAREQMAQLPEQGSILPSLITGGISLVLSIWALYAFSAAGWLPKLPMMRLLLIAITSVYLGRGLLGFFFINQPMGRSPEFWIWSSTVCLAIGLVHMLGVYQQWEYL